MANVRGGETIHKSYFSTKIYLSNVHYSVATINSNERNREYVCTIKDDPKLPTYVF